MNWIDIITDLVFPKGCVGCGKYGSWLCPQCIAKLSNTLPECFYCRRLSNDYATHLNCYHDGIFKNVHIVWKYEKIPKNVMSAYKYNGIRELADILGNLCKSRFRLKEETIITIIPLSKERQSQRGFNQLDLIAKVLLQNLPKNCIYLPDLLIRHFDNSNQAHLPKELRHYNIKNIFRVNSKYKMSMLINYKVLLLDDVVTTGSTLLIAGKALRNAGFNNIYGFALFRGEPNYNS